jgi:hypothetical protein
MWAASENPAAWAAALFLVMWRERTSDQTARVAIMSGIVLLAWLVGTGIVALRGFYFPPVKRSAACRRPAHRRADRDGARAHVVAVPS